MVALSAQDQVDTLRHCGYGFFGLGGNGGSSLMYWRYFPQYNTMIYRMSNLQQEEADLVSNTYLPNLNTLEMQTAGAGANLDTDKAAVWTHNRDEVTDRASLYDYYRKILCNAMQVPPGPWFATNSCSVRMVV